MHPALTRVDHRPWPVPDRRWTWRQRWCDLLFAHWPIPVAELRHLVPAGLRVQEFGGSSWIGVVPFRMEGVARRPFPTVPGLSAFPEINLRIYVERDGKPGVWFLSLEATNPLAVWAGRQWFHLPYQRARIAFTGDAAGFNIVSERREPGPAVHIEATYRPVSEPALAQPGSLEAFLVERYCLYASSPDGRLFRTEVHHGPWPLQKAEGTIVATQLLRPHGLACNGAAPVLHYSRGVDVVAWAPERLV